MRQDSHSAGLKNIDWSLFAVRFQVRAETMRPATSPCKSIFSLQALSVAAQSLRRRLSHRVHISNRLQPHRRSVLSTLRHPSRDVEEEATGDTRTHTSLSRGLSYL